MATGGVAILSSRSPDCVIASGLGTYPPMPNNSSWGGKRAGAGRPSKQPKQSDFVTPALGSRWYCVCAEYDQDQTAFWSVQGAGFIAWQMWQHIPRRPASRTETRTIRAKPAHNIPGLPGYFFVRFDASDPSWRRIAAVRGVDRVLGHTPERPQAISDVAMAILMDQCDAGGVLQASKPPIPLGPVKVGADVLIGGAGPFAGLRGLCQWSSKDRVRIILEAIGLKIDLPRSEVAA